MQPVRLAGMERIGENQSTTIGGAMSERFAVLINVARNDYNLRNGTGIAATVSIDAPTYREYQRGANGYSFEAIMISDDLKLLGVKSGEKITCDFRGHFRPIALIRKEKVTHDYVCPGFTHHTLT